MQVRRKTGKYAHHTPGDGTGFDKLPEHEYPADIMDDAKQAKGDGPDTYGGSQPYPSQCTDPAFGSRK